MEARQFKKFHLRFRYFLPAEIKHITNDIFSFNGTRYNLILEHVTLEDAAEVSIPCVVYMSDNNELLQRVIKDSAEDIVAGGQKRTAKIEYYLPADVDKDKIYLHPVLAKYDLSDIIDIISIIDEPEEQDLSFSGKSKIYTIPAKEVPIKLFQEKPELDFNTDIPEDEDIITETSPVIEKFHPGLQIESRLVESNFFNMEQYNTDNEIIFKNDELGSIEATKEPNIIKATSFFSQESEFFEDSSNIASYIDAVRFLEIQHREIEEDINPDEIDLEIED